MKTGPGLDSNRRGQGRASMKAQEARAARAQEPTLFSSAPNSDLASNALAELVAPSPNVAIGVHEEDQPCEPVAPFSSGLLLKLAKDPFKVCTQLVSEYEQRLTSPGDKVSLEVLKLHHCWLMEQGSSDDLRQLEKLLNQGIREHKDVFNVRSDRWEQRDAGLRALLDLSKMAGERATTLEGISDPF